MPKHINLCKVTQKKRENGIPSSKSVNFYYFFTLRDKQNQYPCLCTIGNHSQITQITKITLTLICHTSKVKDISKREHKNIIACRSQLLSIQFSVHDILYSNIVSCINNHIAKLIRYANGY